MNPYFHASRSIGFSIEQEVVERILDDLWKTDEPLLLDRCRGEEPVDGSGIEVS